MSRPRNLTTTASAVTCHHDDGSFERVTQIGPGRYLSETLTANERVTASRPITRAEAEQASGGPIARVKPRPVRFTVERALLRLLWEHIGEAVGHREVTALIGHEVTRQAVWKAAQRLARSLPVESVKGQRGGYRLPRPGGQG